MYEEELECKVMAFIHPVKPKAHYNDVEGFVMYANEVGDHEVERVATHGVMDFLDLANQLDAKGSYPRFMT